jgi:hypothetical protein
MIQKKLCSNHPTASNSCDVFFVPRGRSTRTFQDVSQQARATSNEPTEQRGGRRFIQHQVRDLKQQQIHREP